MSKPKVAFFSNQFASKSGHGIARYAHRLYTALSRLEDAPNVIPVAAWSNRDPADLLELQAETGLKILPTGRRLTPLLWGALGYPKLEHLLAERVDLVHENSLGYPLATAKPRIVTVHDIGPLTHPEFFTNKPPWIMKKSLDQAVNKAEALVCVSKTTASELQDYVQSEYSVDLSERVYVAQEGVSKRFFATPNLSTLAGRQTIDFMHLPFLLAVGKLSPRKNIEIVIKALGRLNCSIPHHLVIVGGDGWDAQPVKSLVKETNVGHKVHFLGYVSDEALHALYHQAALFVYPSLFEGFGLTVLEAMASGCPVVTSNISSLPEVAGDAALLVNPRDVGEVAAAIETVCLNDGVAEELKSKGLKRAKQFTWKKCAKKVAEIYTQII